MELTVRDATGVELDAACALWRRAESVRTGNAPDLDEAPELASVMSAAAAKPGAHLLVGVLDGDIVATIYGVPLRTDPTAAQVAMLAVEPTLWGRGMGTRMLDALTDVLRERGCLRLRMNVDPGNDRARAFYERHGWRHLGETEADGGDVELIYRLDVERRRPPRGAPGVP